MKKRSIGDLKTPSDHFIKVASKYYAEWMPYLETLQHTMLSAKNKVEKIREQVESIFKNLEMGLVLLMSKMKG